MDLMRNPQWLREAAERVLKRSYNKAGQQVPRLAAPVSQSRGGG
jgi:hypothetical protein